MDGVIIDSEPMHARAAILALKEFNIDVTMDYINNFIGSTTYYMCQKMVADFNINATPKELLKSNEVMKQHLLKAEGHTIVPYVIELIKDLFNNGVKLSIASSSPPEAIEEVLDTLDIKKYFFGYISGMNVAHPKPAPDIFLEAAKRMSVDPQECIVIEDSYHGVTAAEAAGITCIGFVNPNSGNQNLSKAAILAEGFDEIDYAFVNQVYLDHNPLTSILESDYLIIRELAVSDIPDLYQIYQKPHMREFLDDLQDTLEIEQEKHEAYIHNIYRFYGYGLWGVFLKDTGRLIGRCGIELKIFDKEEIYEIGYLIDTDYQGRGYAKESVTAIIQYCFFELHIHRIIAIIDKKNSRSIHLAQQVGMKKISECTRSSRDCYRYEILYN